MPCRVSKEEFEDIIREALAELPQRFAEALELVRIEVRNRPTRRMRKELDIPEDELLLGLYEGRPITRRSVEESGTMPEVIYLFKEEIEAACQSVEEMHHEVRTTVLHELGHHFGLDEENLEDLGYG
jgi:predicted Zn-dependent protease with MMP-like domain